MRMAALRRLLMSGRGMEAKLRSGLADGNRLDFYFFERHLAD